MNIFVVSSLFLAKVAVCSAMPRNCHIIKNRQAYTLFGESVGHPDFLEYRPQRSSIREVKVDIPLTVTLQLLNYTTCEPLHNTLIDMWSADEDGKYSGWDSNAGHFTSFPRYQFTNSSGYLKFQTVIPGWYHGKTVRVHIDAWVNREKYVRQIYFTEAMTQQIAQLSPYYFLSNDEDSNIVLSLVKNGTGYGYTTDFVLGMDGDGNKKAGQSLPLEYLGAWVMEGFGIRT